LFGAFLLAVIFIAAVFAPLLALESPGSMQIELSKQGPSFTAPFGYDVHGGDIYTSMLYGARVSLWIGFLAVFISMLIGTTIGILAGYFGGRIEFLSMRAVDILMAFPGILLALTLVSLLGPSLWSIIIAISITGWTASARIARGQVLMFKDREFVLASHTLGSNHSSVIFSHILPMAWSQLLIHGTFAVSSVIIVEASLSFLGLGATDGSPTWGALLNQGRAHLEDAPHICFFPGAAIFILVMSLNFIGDSLRDYFDPKVK
jgi:peptide/nickel transport system permease protein